MNYSSKIQFYFFKGETLCQEETEEDRRVSGQEAVKDLGIVLDTIARDLQKQYQTVQEEGVGEEYP